MDCKKKRFRSKKEALRSVRNRGQISKIYDRARAYFCKNCKGFHLTTQKKRDKEC